MMTEDHTLTRRDLLKAGAALLGASLMPALPSSAEAAPPAGWNILFILVDQERWFDRWPFPLPGHERMLRRGTTFQNHQAASCVCSSARSVIYTGRHIQHTGVFDNLNAPWQPTMSNQIPTMGKRLHQLGYHAAYQGKWHLGHDLDQTHDAAKVPKREYAEIMRSYGFEDYDTLGDMIDGALGGYTYDANTTDASVAWLRRQGKALTARRKPWFLAVNLVNPHDVMYIDSDAAGRKVQGRAPGQSPIMPISFPPHVKSYEAHWNTSLPASRKQALNAPGRPKAHAAYQEIQDLLLGSWPDEDRRWKVLQDYYFNCIRDADRHVVRLLDEVDALGLGRNTIVILTADHGELGGAHQMRGKGATAYREQNHIPLIIAHPAHKGGRACKALTSQLDLTPTILGLTGRPSSAVKQAAKGLEGHDVSGLLRAPETAAVDAVRPGTLFNYNMFSYQDAAWARRNLAFILGPAPPAQKMARMLAESPDFSGKGAIRSLYDGRYRFSRYFSPLRFNRPTTLEDLMANNEVELFDLKTDPHEMTNLADPKAQGELMVALNDKLNALIDAEVGDDNASFLPLKNGRWTFPPPKGGGHRPHDRKR